MELSLLPLIMEVSFPLLSSKYASLPLPAGPSSNTNSSSVKAYLARADTHNLNLDSTNANAQNAGSGNTQTLTSGNAENSVESNKSAASTKINPPVPENPTVAISSSKCSANKLRCCKCNFHQVITRVG